MGEAHQLIEPRRGHHRVARSGPLAPRALGMGAGKIEQHDIGFSRAQGRVAESHSVQGAGTKIVGDDIGLGNQVEDQFSTPGMREVYRQGALPRVGGIEEPAQVRMGLAVGTRKSSHAVDASTGFHPDHIGAEIAEQPSAQGTGQHPAEIHHANPVESAVGVQSCSVGLGGWGRALRGFQEFGGVGAQSRSASEVDFPHHGIHWASGKAQRLAQAFVFHRNELAVGRELGMHLDTGEIHDGQADGFCLGGPVGEVVSVVARGEFEQHRRDGIAFSGRIEFRPVGIVGGELGRGLRFDRPVAKCGEGYRANQQSHPAAVAALQGVGKRGAFRNFPEPRPEGRRGGLKRRHAGGFLKREFQVRAAACARAIARGESGHDSGGGGQTRHGEGGSSAAVPRGRAALAAEPEQAAGRFGDQIPRSPIPPGAVGTEWGN